MALPIPPAVVARWSPMWPKDGHPTRTGWYRGQGVAWVRVDGKVVDDGATSGWGTRVVSFWRLRDCHDREDAAPYVIRGEGVPGLVDAARLALRMTVRRAIPDVVARFITRGVV